MANSTDNNEILRCDHHDQLQVCTTRPNYRQGKEFKAVKVYTINDESKHILIQNVPSIGLIKEVTKLTSKFGKIETVKVVEDYPTSSEFTNVYYVKYTFLRDARQAKKRLDNRSFFGNLLHVCYAPELETVDDCRQKILTRIESVQKISPNRKSRNKTYRSMKAATTVEQSSMKSSTATSTSLTTTTEGAWQNLLPASKIISKQNV